MSELSSYEGLQLLHTDLIALSVSRLANLERLVAELDARIEEFRELLHKKPRNEQSRQSLATGKIELFDEEFNVNEEFQHGALNLADALDIDERDAAELFFQAQKDTDIIGRTVLECAIIRFHQRRKYLLDCLRLILEQSLDVAQEEGLRGCFQDVVSRVVNDQAPPSSSKFVQKCFSAMGGIKGWLQNLADKVNSTSVLGQGHRAELLETIEYQRVSLVQQHESLGVIVLYLVKANYSIVADFEQLLDIVKKADKYDNLLVHYFPALGAYVSRFGAPEGSGLIENARALNEKLLRQTDQDRWALHYVNAAFRVWWLAEYSGWYGENHVASSITGSVLEEESRQRSRQFMEALKDGAFDFILSLSADVKSADWNNPARHGLRQWLQRKSPALLSDSVPFSGFFQVVLMEQLESFIEGFVTNLPDVLRKLRIEEDEQRQLSQMHEHDLDLERFLVIISYAFEGRPKAAMDAFWDVPDGALMGFLHWASRRASTPLVSAFCEMLQAISEDDECATAAHEFLLDEGAVSSGKMRRTHSLTWNQIFKELTFFSAKIRDRPALSQSQAYRTGKPHNDQAESEPESAMMLECYLRLITRLCTESLAARQFLIQHPSFHLTDLLFQLASSAILSRLRACAFTTLQSLLSHKTKQVGEYLWASLDIWISGGYSPVSNIPKSSAPALSSGSAMEGIFREIGTGFEEPNAFVKLLNALVSPYDVEAELKDDLPFPESLGSSSRMPGIDPYVDFAVGQIFGARATETNDAVQLRLLRLTCLEFISTCLTSFNEDLVIFANQSNVMVDTAIKTSNLAAYVHLHPFSRVMEWMFSDRVMAALFSTIHQDVTDVGNATPDSPLILCLLRGIHVITLIMELQPTYLDIVRPLVKLQPTHRRLPVSNAAFASFEDGVLNHLFIIADLGLYCGTGHPDLTAASLKLLQRLSSSPKLASTAGAGLGRRVDRSKAIAALEANNDAESISRSLLSEMEGAIDTDQGPQSAEYIIKIHILDFLSACLKASPGRPTIAHVLLGFQCHNDNIDIDLEGQFSRGVSLFHTILNLVLDIQLTKEENNVLSWLVTLKYKGLQVLNQLWLSPLSSIFTMNEMRANDSLFLMFVKEVMIQPGLLWDGLELTDPTFLMSSAAPCLSEFLCRRAVTLQYISAELHQIALGHSPSLKQRIIETLLGTTTVDGGQQIQNATIFDLFDFMEIEFDRPPAPSHLSWFNDIDIHACLESHDNSLSTYNLKRVEELLVLRRNELINTDRLVNPQDIVQVDSQAQDLVAFLAIDNQAKYLRASRLQMLRAWVQLVFVMVDTGEFSGWTKSSFVLQALQTILPRLENSLESAAEAMELARLAKALLFSLEFSSESFEKGDIGDLASDKLSYLFQVSLRAIYSPTATPSLKETFYGISYRYLTGMSGVGGVSGRHRRNSTQTIKAAGERLIDLICDDAYGAEQTCRIAALLLLSAFVRIAKQENSKYIIECLVRLNFIGILVDSIQNISNDLRETPREDVGLQLCYFNARLALLLHISQTRFGAAAVLNAGLFHSVKVSGLFAADPDLGVYIDDANAVGKHYDILAAVMKVITSAVLSRGSQNEHTIEQGRKFLSENRSSILAVFKRSAGLATGTEVSEQSVNELADSFILLISVTAFLDFEEQHQKPQSLRTFT